MDYITMASEVANSQVVWSILCIGMTVYVLWHSNKREQDSKEEKKALMKNLTGLTVAQAEQANTMKQISETLNEVEGRMDRMEKHIYKNTSKEHE